MNERDKRAVIICEVDLLLLNASLAIDPAEAARCRDEAFKLMTMHDISLNEVSWPAKQTQGTTVARAKTEKPEIKPVFTIACQEEQKHSTPKSLTTVKAPEDGPTFGGWDSRVHWELEQRAQIQFARVSGGFEVIEENESSIKLRPKGIPIYEPNIITVTLTECNCLTFKYSGKPCKHMYFLAHRKGLFDYKAFPLLTSKEWRQLEKDSKEKEAERRRKREEEERQERERRWREAEPERLKAEKRRATWWYRACDGALEFLGIKFYSLLCGSIFIFGQYFLLNFLGLLKYSLVKKVLIIEFFVGIVMWIFVCIDNDSGGPDGIDRYVHGDPGD